MVLVTGGPKALTDVRLFCTVSVTVCVCATHAFCRTDITTHQIYPSHLGCKFWIFFDHDYFYSSGYLPLNSPLAYTNYELFALCRQKTKLKFLQQSQKFSKCTHFGIPWWHSRMHIAFFNETVFFAARFRSVVTVISCYVTLNIL